MVSVKRGSSDDGLLTRNAVEVALVFGGTLLNVAAATGIDTPGVLDARVAVTERRVSEPPATSTPPSGSRVAVCERRGVANLPVGCDEPVGELRIGSATGEPYRNASLSQQLKFRREHRAQSGGLEPTAVPMR